MSLRDAFGLACEVSKLLSCKSGIVISISARNFQIVGEVRFQAAIARHRAN